VFIQEQPHQRNKKHQNRKTPSSQLSSYSNVYRGLTNFSLFFWSCHRSPCTATVLAPSLPLPVWAEVAAATVLAPALPPPVFAEGAAIAFLAPALRLPVWAEGAAAAVLTMSLDLPVGAQGAAIAVSAIVLAPLVFAEGAAAVLTMALDLQKSSWKTKSGEFPRKKESSF